VFFKSSLFYGKNACLVRQCLPKDKVLAAFSASGIQMDYSDTAPEEEKQFLASECEKRLSESVRRKTANKLRVLLGKPAIDTYLDRVRAALGATPQEIRFLGRRDSGPRIFETIPAATAFLKKPAFDFGNPAETYVYEITYSNGAEFGRHVDSLKELRALHQTTEKLAAHMASLSIK
jgi:hypothetical protein